MRRNAREIMGEVCERHNMPLKDMLGSCRRRKYAWPRQEAMYIAYVECPHLSYPAIGRAFGRDHTTVLHAVRAYCLRNGIDYQSIKRRADIYAFPRRPFERIAFLPVAEPYFDAVAV